MARYWLSSCDLGKALVAIADLMSWPGTRKYNYELRVFCEPVKVASKKFQEYRNEEQRKDYIVQRCSLEALIKVIETI